MLGIVESFIVKAGLVPPPEEEGGGQYLALNISLMRLFGFWSGSDKDVLFSLMIASVSTYLALHILSVDLTDIAESIEIGCSTIGGANTTLKALLCFYYRNEISSIAKELKSICSDICQISPEHKEIFDARERRIRSITINLIVLVLVLFLDWLVVPLVNHTPGEEVQLPVKLRVPFSLHSLHNVVALYVFILVLFFFLSVMYTVPLLLYMTMAMMVCDQLMVLSYLFNKIPNHNDGIPVRSKLNAYIQIHSRILRVGERQKTFFSPIFLLHFTFAMLAISLSAFPIILGTTNARLTKFVGFLVMHLVEVYYYCYFGEELIHWSGEVQNSAYNCNWYDLEEGLKKDLVVVVARAQRPCQLSIGKVQRVSLMTFTDVIKFCYTIFTLLQQLYAQQTQEH